MGRKQIAGVMSHRPPGPGRPQGRASSTRRPTPRSSPRSRTIQEKGSLALRGHRARSATTASSTRATRARCSASASRWCATDADRGRRRLRSVPTVSCRRHTLLVANRGEIARRVIRTRPRRWACAASRSTSTPTPTRRSSREADEAVRLPTGYLDGDGDRRGRRARPAPTRSTRATASCPRTPASPRTSSSAGLVWVGPAPEAIERMGDKIAAKELARRGRRADRCRRPTTRGRPAPSGYPLLVKAAAGGGGKGMRVVASADELDEAVAAAQREALERLRRRPGLPRALRRPRAPHRDPDPRRRPRQPRAPRRARVLDPAPPPEDHRGVALAASSTTRCATRWARPRCALARGARLPSRPAPSSSCSTTRPASSSSSRSTPASRSSTRSPRRSPASTSCASSCASRPGEPLGYDQADVALRRPRDRGAALRRGPGERLPARDRHARGLRAGRRARRCAGTRASRPGSVVGVDFDPMLAKVIAHAPDPAPRRPAGWPWPSSASTSAASSPTATSWSRRCARRASSPATPPPTSSSAWRRPAVARCRPRTSDAAARWPPRCGSRAANRADAAVLADGAERLAQRAAARPSGSRFGLGDGELARRATAPAATARFRFGDAEPTRRVHALDAPIGIDVEIDGRRRRVRGHPRRRRGSTCRRRAATSSFDLRPALRRRRAPRRPAAASSRRCPGKVIELRVAVGDARRGRPDAGGARSDEDGAPRCAPPRTASSTRGARRRRATRSRTARCCWSIEPDADSEEER